MRVDVTYIGSGRSPLKTARPCSSSQYRLRRGSPKTLDLPLEEVKWFQQNLDVYDLDYPLPKRLRLGLFELRDAAENPVTREGLFRQRNIRAEVANEMGWEKQKLKT